MKIFFLVLLLLKKKGIEINDECDNEISTTSKLRIHNYNKRTIIFFSDEEKSDEKKINIIIIKVLFWKF
jgi:hypothetical protein